MIYRSRNGFLNSCYKSYKTQWLATYHWLAVVVQCNLLMSMGLGRPWPLESTSPVPQKVITINAWAANSSVISLTTVYMLKIAEQSTQLCIYATTCVYRSGCTPWVVRATTMYWGLQVHAKSGCNWVFTNQNSGFRAARAELDQIW